MVSSLPRTIYALVFLLPIGAAVIEHWMSGFFVVIALLALATMHRNVIALSGIEKLLLLAATMLYLAFVVATVLHGWNKELGAQVRFFLFVPLLLLFKAYPESAAWLLRGTLVAIVPMAFQAFYDVQIHDLHRANGAYGPLFIGSIASIFGLMAFWEALRPGYRRAGRVLFFAMFLMAGYTVLVSVSRAGILITIVGMVALILLSHYSRVKKGLFLGLLVVIGLFSYWSFERVKYEIHRPFEQVEKFESITAPKEFSDTLGSGGQRLTWWKTAVLVIRDNPLTGIGMFRFDEYAKRYIESGVTTYVADQASHPHNMFLEMWVSRGVFGFASLLLFLGLAFKIYLKNYRRAPNIVTLGLVHLCGIVIFGLFESAPVVKGNYIAFFGIYLAAFLVWSQDASEGHRQRRVVLI